jgi:two-component system NarL family response regulator
MSEPPLPIRVLLVDDHFVVRLGLRSLFEAHPAFEVAGDVPSGQAAVEAFAALQPDVSLIDLRMPGLSGIETTLRIRARSPAAKIIILTTYDGDEDIFQALQAGAMAYLLKTIDSQTLLETVEAVQAGKYRLPPEIAERLASRLATPDLTPREREVLSLIVDGHSNKEIACKLSLAENTVKNHVKTILQKLGVQDRTQASMAAIRRGLVHID